uniref:Uncharacterized protein n=1 Tax=Nothoprocta perdicaria TaxID=30464 RepID=A0A8C6ZBU0_NOTPE
QPGEKRADKKNPFYLVYFWLCSVKTYQYMVVFPAVIHHSQEEKLCIHLRSLPEAVSLTVTLEREDQNHTLVEQNVEKPDTIKFFIRQPEEVVFVHALIRSGDSVLFEGGKKVLIKPKKNVILVETDKAFYKPGETVKFRIVNIDDDLNVIKNIVSITMCFSTRRSLNMTPCIPIKLQEQMISERKPLIYRCLGERLQ